MSASFALDEFGRSLGVGELVLPQNGCVNIALGPQRRLSLEASGNEVLLYLSVELPHLDQAQILTMLQACDLRRRAPHEPGIQIGCRGSGADTQLLMLVRWPADRLQASQLHGSLELFERSLNEWLGLRT